VRCATLSVLDEDGRRVDAYDVCALEPLRQPPRDSSGAAPDLEHPGAAREWQVVEVGVEHRALLKVGCTQLEHIGEPLLHGEVGLVDGCIDVRHVIRPFVRLTGRTVARRTPRTTDLQWCHATLIWNAAL
jgi:hypothetical protein